MSRLTPARFRALTQLDAFQDGCTEAIMLAQGHSIDNMVGLIRAGFASVQTERRGGGKPIEIARVKITAKGRLALRMPRGKSASRENAIKAALKIYPQLTRDEAEQITMAFGF